MCVWTNGRARNGDTLSTQNNNSQNAPFLALPNRGRHGAALPPGSCRALRPATEANGVYCVLGFVVRLPILDARWRRDLCCKCFNAHTIISVPEASED
ncbi:unnamed protein product [Caretta caretta]